MDSEKQSPKPVIISPKKEHIHTVIWIHGLKQTAEEHAKFFDFETFDNCKIILPQAPKAYVTVGKNQYNSWYDIKFRNQKSYTVPFDEAFSSQEVHQNFQNILKPIIIGARKELNKQEKDGKLIIGGFSQGCGMALHSFYQQHQEIDAILGISGYLFPFSKYNPQDKRPVRILYGTKDQLRPWQYVKVVYENKISEQNGKLKMVEQTGHEVNESMQEKMRQFIRQII